MININIWVALAIIFIHWVADFVCQTKWQAENKSNDNEALFMHVCSYTGVFSIPALCYLGICPGYVFLLITFWMHILTDYFTSRWTTKLYLAGKTRAFFKVVGLDQVLHYIQLFLTFQLMSQWKV